MSIRSTLVPCLLVLSPLAYSAVNISDDVELDVSMRLQTRIEMANANNATGGDYDIWENASTNNPNDINMMIRRARLYLKGKYKDDIKFQLTFMSDNIGANDDRDPTGVDVRYAWISKDFKFGDLKHTIKFGLDKTWFVSGDFDSSSRMLFATNRQSIGYNNGRQVNLSYKLKAPLFNFGVDFSDDEGTGAGNDSGDLLWSSRIEAAFSEDSKLSKRSESFLGKDGFGYLIGFGYGGKTDGSDDNDDYTQFTLDYNLHWNQLSLNADFISAADRTGADIDSLVYLVQAGWAIPMDARIIEPALRIAIIDNNTDDDNEATTYDDEGGASGTYIDAGVNIYFDGHHNKLNIGLVSYSPESGDGDATVFRIQHQLNF